MPRNSCPDCAGTKDVRSSRCMDCCGKYRVSDPNRWYTAKDGYQSKRINGKLYYRHRVIMADFLGRELSDKEVVHHKDGNPTNNIIENLELIVNHSEHMRQHATPERMKAMSRKAHAAKAAKKEKENAYL